MKKNITHPVVGPVTLSRTRRSTRISLSVRPDGSVRLSFPPWVTQKRALGFLEQKLDWIADSRRRMAEKYSADGGAGGRDPFGFGFGFGLGFGFGPASVPADNRSAAETKRLTEKLRAEAKATLPAMVERLAALHGFRYGAVRIKATKSRWGSCNGQGDINLSLFLVSVPRHLAEYIVLHELCHTVHHNHSKSFHELLDRVTDGRHRALNKELKAFRPGI